jgi:hypothetical protein
VDKNFNGQTWFKVNFPPTLMAAAAAAGSALSARLDQHHLWLAGVASSDAWCTQVREVYLKNEKFGRRQDTYAAIRKLLASLDDPFTRFLEPERLAALRTGTKGSVTGGCAAAAAPAALTARAQSSSARWLKHPNSNPVPRACCAHPPAPLIPAPPHRRRGRRGDAGQLLGRTERAGGHCPCPWRPRGPG